MLEIMLYEIYFIKHYFFHCIHVYQALLRQRREYAPENTLADEGSFCWQPFDGQFEVERSDEVRYRQRRR